MSETVSIYKLGMTGKAYDVPGTCRAYTYQHQPDNQGAWRLGEAMSIASKAGGGDYIDTGLGLLKQLELKGYGVYELDEAKAPEWQRCQTCGGTGDVHRADGEYLGECHCSKAHKAAIEAGDLMAIAEECGAGRMAENVAQVTRCDLDRIIQFVRNQQAGQQKPVGSVFTMQPCFPGEPKRAHAQLHVALPAGTKLYAEPQQSQVNRIPAGLYAELEALRTLRDATGVYLQGYMRDEIEDEESCSADQHDSACTVKLALDKARALEWKGCGDA